MRSEEKRKTECCRILLFFCFVFSSNMGISPHTSFIAIYTFFPLRAAQLDQSMQRICPLWKRRPTLVGRSRLSPLQRSLFLLSQADGGSGTEGGKWKAGSVSRSTVATEAAQSHGTALSTARKDTRTEHANCQLLLLASFSNKYRGFDSFR